MKRSFAKRITVFLLSVAMVFTLMPWLGAQNVYADDISVNTLEDLGTLTVDMSDGSRFYFDDHNVDPAAFVTSVMIMMENGIIGGDYDLSEGWLNTAFWLDLNKDGDYDVVGGCHEYDELWWLNPWEEVTLTGTKWTRSIPKSTTYSSSLDLPYSDNATGTGAIKYYSKLIFKFPTISDGKATLQYASVKWDGSYKKPAVTVKHDGEKLEKGVDYSVVYKKNKNVGKATVSIFGKGWFQGFLTKTFIIRPVGTYITNTTSPSKGTVKVTWHKQDKKMSTTRITGYQIQVATNSAFTKDKVTKVRTGYANTSKTITDLKAGKTYYVRVRTYKKVDGVNYWSNWSTVKKVTTKK